MSTPEVAMTVTDVLIQLRDQLVTALDNQDRQQLLMLDSAFRSIETALEQYYSASESIPLLVPLDHMIASIQDFFHGVTWKSSVPTVDEIHAAAAGKISDRLK